ncbi:MAG: tetratricopeptide repeat protein [Nannocystaceae bacterium]
MRRAAAVLGFAVVAAVRVATAEPPAPEPKLPSPPPSGPRGELPPPPPGAEDGGDTEGESAEDIAMRRQQEFEEHLQRAQAAVTRERHDEAIREYSAALRLQPGDPTALLGRANARKARTAPERCPTQAIGDLRLLESYDPRGAWLEQRATLLSWMAPCGPTYAADRLLLAKELAAEKPGAPGRPADVRVTVARLLLDGVGDDASDTGDAARGAARVELERYRAECDKLGTQPTPEALRLQADLYGDLGEPDKAAAIYRLLAERHRDSAAVVGVDKILRDIELQRELKRLDATQGFRPTPEAEAAYSRGMQALRDGDGETAQAQFEAATEASPWFPRAHYALGVTHARNGNYGAAVEALQRAIHMEPTDHQAHMTLGLIYKKEFAGAEDQLAIKHLAAALRLRPDLFQLHMLLGELYARTDREKAREHYERFLRATDTDDPDAARAQRALEELDRAIRQDEPAAIPPPAEESLRSLPPDLQRMINEAYLRSTEYQDLAYAERILLEAKDRFPSEPVVYNQLAHMAFAQDRTGDARRCRSRASRSRRTRSRSTSAWACCCGGSCPTRPSRTCTAPPTWARSRRATCWPSCCGSNPRRGAPRPSSIAISPRNSDYDLDYDRARALQETIDRRLLQFYLAAAPARSSRSCRGRRGASSALSRQEPAAAARARPQELRGRAHHQPHPPRDPQAWPPRFSATSAARSNTTIPTPTRARPCWPSACSATPRRRARPAGASLAAARDPRPLPGLPRGAREGRPCPPRDAQPAAQGSRSSGR